MDSEVTIEKRNEPRSGFKWLMLIFIMFNMIFIGGFALTSFSVLAPLYIRPELGWSTLDYALVWGASPVGIVILSFVSGVLFDKIRYRYLMSIAVVAAGISVFFRAFATGVPAFYALFLLIGLAQGLYNPGNIKVITAWFPRDLLFRANGILISGSPIGMFSGFNFAVPFMNAVGGWRNMYLIFGVVICCLAFLWLFVAKDRTNQESELSKTMGADTTETSVWVNIKMLLKTKQVWLCCLSDLFFMGLIMAYLGFAPTVFTSWPGVDTAGAGFLTSMANVGSLVGYYVLPPISDKLKIRKPFVAASSLFTGIFWFMGVTCGDYNAAIVWLLLGGFMNGWAVTGVRVLLQEHPKIAGQRSGTALGMLITFQRIGAVLTPFAYTAMVGANLTPSMAMGVIISTALISTILLSFADETGERAKKKLIENKA